MSVVSKAYIFRFCKGFVVMSRNVNVVIRYAYVTHTLYVNNPKSVRKTFFNSLVMKAIIKLNEGKKTTQFTSWSANLLANYYICKFNALNEVNQLLNFPPLLIFIFPPQITFILLHINRKETPKKQTKK